MDRAKGVTRVERVDILLARYDGGWALEYGGKERGTVYSYL